MFTACAYVVRHQQWAVLKPYVRKWGEIIGLTRAIYGAWGHLVSKKESAKSGSLVPGSSHSEAIKGSNASSKSM